MYLWGRYLGRKGWMVYRGKTTNRQEIPKMLVAKKTHDHQT